jgi:hypothetical protein
LVAAYLVAQRESDAHAKGAVVVDVNTRQDVRDHARESPDFHGSGVGGAAACGGGGGSGSSDATAEERRGEAERGKRRAALDAHCAALLT